jgi:hypothetical protein
MRVACPIDQPLNVLTCHLLPALALIALSTLAGGTWFDSAGALGVLIQPIELTHQGTMVVIVCAIFVYTGLSEARLRHPIQSSQRGTRRSGYLGRVRLCLPRSILGPLP